jgi:putative ATP-dependent endonuclease of OLD family
MTDKAFAAMHTWAVDENLGGWIGVVKSHGVFFSEPLDLDLAMLAAYPQAYQAIIPAGGGPKMTPADAAEVVLGEGGAGLDAYGTLYPNFSQYMPAYRYHFLTHSKPATHLRAFAHLAEEARETSIPATYRELLNHVSDNLKRD